MIQEENEKRRKCENVTYTVLVHYQQLVKNPLLVRVVFFGTSYQII